MLASGRAWSACDAVSLHLVRGLQWNTPQTKHLSRDWELLKRFSRSKVKGQRSKVICLHCVKCDNGGGIHVTNRFKLMSFTNSDWSFHNELHSVHSSICEILSATVGKLEVMKKSRYFGFLGFGFFSAGFKPQHSWCQIEPQLWHWRSLKVKVKVNMDLYSASSWTHL